MMQKQPETIKVGFWNIERATNPARDRTEFVLKTLDKWVAQKPDVIILAEVTQKGEELAQVLNTRFGPAYQATFIPVLDSSGERVSPCSFLVLGRPGYTVDAIGASSRRPYIKVRLPSAITVAAIHATADQGEKALTDIIDYLTDFKGTAVLGDMNFPQDKEVSRELSGWLNDLTRMGWAPVYPNQATFRSKRSGSEKVLDYGWVVGQYWQATPLQSPPPDFVTIDHAPIFFQIRSR